MRLKNVFKAVILNQKTFDTIEEDKQFKTTIKGTDLKIRKRTSNHGLVLFYINLRKRRYTFLFSHSFAFRLAKIIYL